MMAASARTRPLAQACAIALAAWLAGACNQALGLDPVALDDDASVVPVDAAACDPVVAADIAGGAAVDNLFARGVAVRCWYWMNR